MYIRELVRKLQLYLYHLHQHLSCLSVQFANHLKLFSNKIPCVSKVSSFNSNTRLEFTDDGTNWEMICNIMKQNVTFDVIYYTVSVDIT